jgi:hypothetical protein
LKICPSLLALILALPASAQERLEAALTYDKVQGKTQTVDSITVEPKDNSALGLAFAWLPWNLGEAQVGLTAAYRFKGSSDLVVSVPGISEAAANYRYEHLAIGGRYMWRKPFDFGIGLQCRFEKLAFEPKSAGTTWSANLARPWVEAMVGYTFPQNPSVKPFIAFSLAIPLTSESKPTNPANSDAQAKANQEQLVKSTAPGFEMALRAGLRF